MVEYLPKVQILYLYTSISIFTCIKESVLTLLNLNCTHCSLAPILIAPLFRKTAEWIFGRQRCGCQLQSIAIPASSGQIWKISQPREIKYHELGIFMLYHSMRLLCCASDIFLKKLLVNGLLVISI